MIASLIRVLRLPAVLMAIASAPAAENNLVGRPVPLYDSGLQLSLTTNAYKVYGGEVVTPVAKIRSTRDIVLPRVSLVASVMLANRSDNDLSFTFDDQAAASRKFNFRVINVKGEQVWTSSSLVFANVVEEEPVTAVLKRRTKWSSTLQIPLKIGDAWLTPGVYTLEAAIAGEPKIGATTLFEVVLPPTPPPPPEPGKDTGIKGQVLRSAGQYVTLDGGVLAPTVIPYGVKASVRIVEVFPPGVETFRGPWVYELETAADGTFQIATFPGRYRVTATAKDGVVILNKEVQVAEPVFRPIPPQSSVSVETTVQSGEYTTVRLILGGGVIYQPPSVDTGIRGSVVRSVEGGNAPVPVSGATVVVEEIRFPTPELAVMGADALPVSIVRPGFRWVGTTNASGEFTLNTPPGRFRIVATVGVSGGGPLTDPSTGVIAPNDLPVQLRGTAEASVTAGQFTSVEVKVLPTQLPVEKDLVWTVGPVQAAVLRTAAGAILRVNASGTVTTSGWGLPELRQKRVTAEGIVEFEFLAKKPTGATLQVISPIQASTGVPLPANAKGVRVISATNSATVSLGEIGWPPPPILQAF
jgi:hypothetical protein